MSDLLPLLKERYSCRAFKDTPLTEAQIESILEAARVASTAANKQPIHVWVVKSPEGLGNVWVGSFDPAVIKAQFPETAGPGANHDKRQTKEQFVSEV